MGNVAEVTVVPYRLLFIASPNDRGEIRALRQAEADYIVMGRDAKYSQKINHGYRKTTEPYIFTGADDLTFHPGWDTVALAQFKQGIGVVGTNDLGNARVMRGQHATHSLVARWYADLGTIDGEGIYCENYTHQFVDDELVATAKFRGAWAFASGSKVEHMHPFVRGTSGPKGQMDATYRKGLSQTRQDGQLFKRRQALWSPHARR